MSASWSNRWRGALVGVVAGWLLAALLAVQGASSARDEGAEATLPADLAKIPGDAALLISVRAADLWGSEFGKAARQKLENDEENPDRHFQKEYGLPLDQIERLTVVSEEVKSADKPLLFVRTTGAYDAEKVGGGKDRKQSYKGKTLYERDTNVVVYPLDDRSLVYGSKNAIAALIDRPVAKAASTLSPAVRLAAEKHAIVAAFNVKAFNEAVGDKLPGEAEPFKPLLKANLGTLALDFGAESRAEVRMSFGSEADAKAALKPLQTGQALAVMGLERGIAEWSKEKEVAGTVALLRQVRAALKTAKLEQRGDTLQASAAMKIDPASAGAAALEAIQKVRAAAARTQSSNNLKQIALSMHSYLDTNRTFPPQAAYDKNGKPMLSWRVLVLPYIGEQELYKKFRLDEPWDSEHNKKLLAQMPKVYASPADEKSLKDHTTHYQGFVGKGAFFEGKKGIGIADITDGTSNTLMIVEASKAVPWTKPEDISYDPAKPLPKLGVPGKDGFLASLCDGSLRFIAKGFSEKTLRNAITRNDGNPLGSDF